MRPTRYNDLSTADKRAFLSLFKDDAADGPASAAFCLIELGIVVPEGDVAIVFRELGWPTSYIAKLALLAPNHFTL